MEGKIWEEMREIEEQGGIIQAITNGHLPLKLAWQAYGSSGTCSAAT